MAKMGMGGSRGNKSVTGKYPHSIPRSKGMTGGKSQSKTPNPLKGKKSG